MTTISSSTTSTTAYKVTADTTGALVLQTGATPTTAMTIDANQRSKFPTTIGIGNATPSTSGSGITFPATQSASSDANTLDDYEEGTFTPTFTSGAGSFTTTSVTGNYTKIGRFVNVYMTFTITTVGTASGSLTYSGLPFANGNSARFINFLRENGTTGIMGQTWIDASATTGAVRKADDVSYTLASGQNYLINLNYYTT
jgi:hypothetical protein